MGQLSLMAAACVWAAYTHAFRLSRLSVLAAAGLASIWSFAALVAALATAAGPPSSARRLVRPR